MVIHPSKYLQKPSDTDSTNPPEPRRLSHIGTPHELFVPSLSIASLQRTAHLAKRISPFLIHCRVHLLYKPLFTSSAACSLDATLSNSSPQPDQLLNYTVAIGSTHPA